MDVINPQGDSTNINLKKQIIKTEPASGRLSILIYTHTGWKEKLFEPTRERVLITDNNADSDLPVSLIPNFSGAIVLQKCDDKWVILNTGRASAKFSFNGQILNHFIMEKGEKVLIMNNNGTSFIISALNDDGKTTKLNKQGPPFNNEFALKINDTEHSFLREKLCLIGKHSYSDLTVGEADFIAAIYEKNREFFIQPLDPSTPILVNSAPCNEARLILRGSTISLGKTTATFELPDTKNSAEIKISTGIDKLNAERLVLLPATKNSDGTKKSILYMPAAGKSGFIGRDPVQANIVINSKTVSKKHAQVIVYENCIMLLDCYSTNGTYVNGERISKRTVHPGDIIEFGEEKFILSYV
ncbi:MAG TPA: FHA domain-containing protein [Victivallales bacterium]|nr:FHA domain-containing protein [Victivallales bacterium]HPO91325.1 FHA domain-containing protein [Victivallales bacterium]HRR28030.1 FHA domain-containing protein [Victivallales bacterium]